MSKRCQKCGAELADNMNFCPQCHAKYEAPAAAGGFPAAAGGFPAAAGGFPAAGTGCSPTVVDKVLPHLLQQLTNPQFKLSAVKTGENSYGLKLENPMVHGAANLIIENHAGSLSVRMDKLKTFPAVMGWICLIFAFYIMLPLYFLLFAPLTKKTLKGFVNSLNAAIRHPHAFLLPDQPDFGASGKNAEEIARLCFAGSQVPYGARATFAGSLDMSLVNSAVANYAQGVTPDKIICLIDNTPAGLPAGSCGVVFTLDRVYFRFRMLKIYVSNQLGYNNISGGLEANCSITGSTFKYNAILTASDPRNNLLWGSIPGMPNGEIPEPGVVFQEKLLQLVRAMQNRG